MVRRVFASCLAGVLSACAPAGPEVHLQIVPSAQLGTLDRFDRLTLEVSRCDDTPPVTVEIALGAPEPETRFELDVLPGAPFSAWLRAHEGAAATAEACTEWLVLEDGELNVPLTLTATAGLCPVSRDDCPS